MKNIQINLGTCRLDRYEKNKNSRKDICLQLKQQLRKLEATKPFTYLILPANHPDFPIKKKLNKKT